MNKDRKVIVKKHINHQHFFLYFEAYSLIKYLFLYGLLIMHKVVVYIPKNDQSLK